MIVELSKDDIESLIDALRALFSEQPSSVSDEERALLSRLESLIE